MDLYNEIERVAYELWERRGREHGTDCEDWYQAEIIVKARSAQSRAAKEKTEKKPVKTKKAAPEKIRGKSAKSETKGPAKKTKPGGPSKK